MIARALKKGTVFKTGTGQPNRVSRTTAKTVYIRSSKESSSEIDFPVGTIISAAAFFIRVRHVERKELEAFHSYNSALFGILAMLFMHRARVQKGLYNLLRLVMKGLRFYLAGAEKSPGDLRVANAVGAKHILLSYFWLRDKAERTWKGPLTQFGMRLLLDSGAYSLWSAQLKGKKVRDITLDEYCSFIQRHHSILEGYFVLDVVGDHQATMHNLKEMEKRGLTPIPVYHMGTPIEELDRLVAIGYPVIGLGGTVGKSLMDKMAFFQKVFTRHPMQAFHGLGVSLVELLATFKFFSADSRTWLNGRIAGRLLDPFKRANLSDQPGSILAANARFLANLEDAAWYERFASRVFSGYRKETKSCFTNLM